MKSVKDSIHMDTWSDAYNSVANVTRDKDIIRVLNNTQYPIWDIVVTSLHNRLEDNLTSDDS